MSLELQNNKSSIFAHYINALFYPLVCILLQAGQEELADYMQQLKKYPYPASQNTNITCSSLRVKKSSVTDTIVNKMSNKTFQWYSGQVSPSFGILLNRNPVKQIY